MVPSDRLDAEILGNPKKHFNKHKILWNLAKKCCMHREFVVESQHWHMSFRGLFRSQTHFLHLPMGSATMLGKLMLAVGVVSTWCEECPSDDTCALQMQMKSRYDPPEGLGTG